MSSEPEAKKTRTEPSEPSAELIKARKQACEDMMSATIQRNEAGKVTIQDILNKYNLQANNDDVIVRLQTLARLRSEGSLTQELQECTLKTKLTALELVKKEAKHMYGTRFYAERGSANQISFRLPFPEFQILESSRVDSIANEIRKNEGIKTTVIGGASGTGKTCMMLGLGNFADNMMVVYICSARWETDIAKIKAEAAGDNAAKDEAKSNPQTDKANNAPIVPQDSTSSSSNNMVVGNPKVGAASPEVEEAKKARDENMLKLLVTIIKESIPEQVLRVMSNEEEWQPGEKLHVVVALDEMGDAKFAEAVRAMCSLSGSDLRDNDELNWAKKYINVHLAVVGTGLGSGTAPVGSTPTKYQVIFASQNDEKDNEKIFGHHFLNAQETIMGKPDGGTSRKCGKKRPAERDKVVPEVYYKALVNKLSPLLQALVRGNSRMAAIIGYKLYEALSVFENPNDFQRLIDFADLDSLFYGAALRFKSLNSLETVSFNGIWELLVFSLRLHYFPLGPYDKINVKMLQVRFGLVVDKMEWGKTDFTPSPSRYELPAFSVLLLAKLTGIKEVTKSLTSGASFEEYVFAVVHLLACAAGNANWFRLALLGHGGQGELEPLHYHCVSKKNWPYANKISMMKECLPAPDKHLQVSFSQDLSDWKNGIPELVATALTKMKKESNDTHHHIASFRSPDKATFADVFVFIEDELFLFQCKDHRKNDWLYGVHHERWKMGATDDDAVIAFFDKSLTDAEKSARINAGITKHVTARKANGTKSTGTGTQGTAQKDTIAKKSKTPATLHQILVNHQNKASTADSTGCALLKYFQPIDTLSGLSAEWKKKTGITLKKIHRCFITPNPVTDSSKILQTKGIIKLGANAQGVLESVSAGEFFISTSKLEFLKFDTSREKESELLNISRTADLERYKVMAVDEKYSKGKQTNIVVGPSQSVIT